MSNDFDTFHLKQINTLTEAVELLLLVKSIYPHFSEEEITDIITRNNKNTKFLVVMNSDEIIAFCSFSIGNSLSRGKFLFIHEIIVRDGYRRIGISKFMVEKLEEMAKIFKMKNIDLICDNTSWKAHEFWESIGFENTAKYFRKDLNTIN